MRFLPMIALPAVLVLGCGSESPRPGSEMDTGGKTETKDTTSVQTEPPPDSRLALLEKDWESFEDVVIRHDASSLPGPDKRLVSRLAEAAEIVDELYMLQLHPETLTWRSEIAETGVDIEKRVFNRSRSPWCSFETSRRCCALADEPLRVIGHGMWPSSPYVEPLSHKALGALIGQDDVTALLSPFSAVRGRGPTGFKGKMGFDALPHSQTELFGPHMRRLAVALEKAAKESSNETLAAFLRSRATAFLVDDVFPYERSESDGIAVSGPWEVVIGPYDTHRSPYGIKAFFGSFFGQKDEAHTQELAKLGAALCKKKGADGCEIAFRAVDVWIASGAARLESGALSAFHLSSEEKGAERTKVFLMVNHIETLTRAMKARAEILLSASPRALLSLRAVRDQAALDEIARTRYTARGLSDAKSARDVIAHRTDQILAAAASRAAGSKLAAEQEDRGVWNEQETQARHFAAVMSLVEQLQGSLDGHRAQTAALVLGWYMSRGAVVWDEEKEKLSLDADALVRAATDLIGAISETREGDDPARARKLIDAHVRRIGGRRYELEGPLKRIPELLREARLPSLRYDIAGL